MSHLLATVVITALVGAAPFGAHDAIAQNTAPAANPDAHTPAVANRLANNPGAPAAGANSFTEAQAKSRIEAAGYSDISDLVKDKDGIWRGKAFKQDRTLVDVALDYQGNIVSK
jgi:hypothetical protein